MRLAEPCIAECHEGEAACGACLAAHPFSDAQRADAMRAWSKGPLPEYCSPKARAAERAKKAAKEAAKEGAKPGAKPGAAAALARSQAINSQVLARKQGFTIGGGGGGGRLEDAGRDEARIRTHVADGMIHR